MTTVSGPTSVSQGAPVQPVLGDRAAFLGLAKSAFRDQAWFIAITLLYISIAYVITEAYEWEFSLWLYSKFKVAIYVTLAVAFLTARIFLTIWRERPERPLAFVWKDLIHIYRVPLRIVAALPPFILLPIALSATTSLKRLIPVIHPFDWDAALAKIDALVHFGYQPWELLQPILGYPMVTKVIDYAYGPPWFWMMLCMQFWQMFTLNPRRVQFFVTFVLCWALLGNVLATALASVGPVYFGEFVDGLNPFAPLMAYLDSVAENTRLLARLSQHYLWGKHISQDLTVGVGISAMPSMHIAMSFLFALVCWHAHWTLRSVSIVYLIVLLIGSVHLGWHYAIDGYVSIILTYAIWWVAGRVLSRPRAPDTANQDRHATRDEPGQHVLP